MNSVFLLPKPLAFAATSSPSLLVYQTCTPSSIMGAPKVNCAHRSNALRKSPLELRSPPRVWLDNCCQLLISSIFGLSCALSVHGAVAGVMYPCEDIDRYYSGVSGLEGAALMEKLSSIVSVHRSLRYKEVWDALKILDAADLENPEAASEIIEIYSLRAVPKSLAGKPEGWNREHLWPRSYGLTDGPALTDLYNIRPADANDHLTLTSTVVERYLLPLQLHFSFGSGNNTIYVSTLLEEISTMVNVLLYQLTV